MTRRYSTVNRPRRSSKASGARGWYDSPELKGRSRAWLRAHPYCVRCGHPATIADHITPVRPDDREGVLRGPIQSMCRPCHSANSREDQTGRQRVAMDPSTGLPMRGEDHW
jgi:5-methylcytosine-specific restriction protein A